MEETPKKYMYSMSEDYLITLYDECRTLADFTKFSIDLKNDMDITDYNLSTLCELYSVCFKISHEIDRYFEECATQESEDGSLQFILDDKEIKFLQTGILTKMLITKDLLSTANISSMEH